MVANTKESKMKVIFYSIILILNIFFSGCDRSQINMKITAMQTLKNVPSASGITKTKNGIYIIGDNTPWIYKISTDLEVIEKLPILNDFSDSIIPKNIKPDFEAITEVEWGQTKELFIFGSGSKSPQRNILIGIEFGEDTKVNTYDLTEFYNTIKSSTKLDENNLNIEAAAANEKNLFLFNRGENMILKYKLSEFIDYIKNKGACPIPNYYTIILPRFNGVYAGFSGASFIPNEEKIIFTASLENTNNPIDDGEILGSYIGAIMLKEIKNDYQPDCILISNNKQPLKIKVESIEVMSNNDTLGIEILLVTDNDKGGSEIIKANLK